MITFDSRSPILGEVKPSVPNHFSIKLWARKFNSWLAVPLYVLLGGLTNFRIFEGS